MKYNSKTERHPIGDWIREYGKENPSPEFHKTIISKIESTQIKTEYQPVIPSWVLRLMITGAVAILILGILFIPLDGNPEIGLKLPAFISSQFQVPKFSPQSIQLKTNLVLSLSILIFSIMAFLATFIHSRKINY